MPVRPPQPANKVSSSNSDLDRGLLKVSYNSDLDRLSLKSSLNSIPN